MTLRDWVGSWEDVPMNAAQQRAVDALAKTLDTLKPHDLDRMTSSVSLLEDDVDIWPDQALIHWLDQTENTRDHCGENPDGEWPTYAAEVVADILSGYREVENTYWRGRWRRTRWFDVRDPAKPERLATEVGPALWWFFMTLPGATVARRRMDFDVHPEH